MKKSLILLAGTAAIAAAPAHAREGQLYAGIEGGVSFEDQVDVDIAATSPQENGAFADTNTGVDVDAVLGYDFGAFRLEGEAGYKRNSYDSLTVASSNLIPGVAAGTVVDNEDDLRILSGMVNGLLEFGSDDGVQFFVGGGVGVANVDLPVEVAGLGVIVDDSATDFAYQGLAGFRVAVSDNIDIGVKYRYFVIDEFELEAVGGTPLEVDYEAHSVLASLLYNFGSAPPPPPPAPAPAPAPVAAPPPPPAPPPAPEPTPCNTGPYIVFFDFDESVITADAATILDNAASAYTNCGTARVMLAGHTDRSGSVTYNMALAERRNMSVMQYLSGRGIPASRITGEAFGESNPRVPTADGVRELQNRRVEVTYGPGSGM